MAAKKDEKKRRRKSNSFTIPVALALPIANLAFETYQDTQTMGFSEAIRWLLGKLTGYYAQPNWPDWRAKHMRHGTLPIAVGYGVHWVAAKAGINRAIARAGIPIFRI